MQIIDHYLINATQITSPNFDNRPDSSDISLLVIHCISLPPGEFGGNFIDQLFCNTLNPEDHPSFNDIYQLKVSAHLLIRRNGDIHQYVAFNKRAWHAGLSAYDGRERCNDFSIGIELEGDVHHTYTDQQYLCLAELTQTLCAYYPDLHPQRIVGHSDIAPQRKTDPGPFFDWPRYRDLLTKDLK